MAMAAAAAVVRHSVLFGLVFVWRVCHYLLQGQEVTPTTMCAVVLSLASHHSSLFHKNLWAPHRTSGGLTRAHSIEGQQPHGPSLLLAQLRGSNTSLSGSGGSVDGGVGLAVVTASNLQSSSSTAAAQPKRVWKQKIVYARMKCHRASDCLRSCESLIRSSTHALMPLLPWGGWLGPALSLSAPHPSPSLPCNDPCSP